LFGYPLARLKKVDLPHPLDQAMDWTESVTKENEVGREHYRERHREDDALDDRDRFVDRDRRQRQQQRRDGEQHGVDPEDPPEER
jgi:hypothetical protein